MINKLNKQGYTKIELLIIVVLLGIVAFITINRTSYAFALDNESAINEIIDLIEIDAEDYGLAHLDLFADTTVTYITVQDLVDENYTMANASGKVLNPSNKNESYNDNKIKLEYDASKNKVEATFIK